MRLPGYKRMRRALARLRRRLAPRGAILMYHRVGTGGSDPWRLRVSPQHFAEQLAVLRARGGALPLRQLAAAQQRRALPRRAVALTFDDGYADNLLNARPLLEQYAIPATVFITSGQIGSAREFWWDELERLVLLPDELPPTLNIQIGTTAHTWQLGAAVAYTPEQRRRDEALLPWDGVHGSRLAFYHTLWSALRPLPYEQQQRALDAIRTWVGAAHEPRPTHRALVAEEVRALAAGGLVEIGAHTMTHPSLPVHQATYQRQEICQSKEELVATLGSPVTTFSYPFGDCTPATIAIVREAGFACACTTHPATVWAGDDPYKLPRLEVGDWNGAEFERRLADWLAQ